MTRYLTPSKIGLLALAVLITEGVIPNDSMTSVISFLMFRILPLLATDCEAHANAKPAPLIMTIADFEDAIKSLPSSVPGRTLLDKFLEKLWSLDNLHCLHEFFRDLKPIMYHLRLPGQAERDEEKLSKNRVWVHRASPVGMFMRRCHVEFFRLQFDDIVKFWSSFLKFRGPSKDQWKRRHSSLASPVLDSNFTSKDMSDVSQLAAVLYPNPRGGDQETLDLSREEMERLLEFQLEKLQRRNVSFPCHTLNRTRFWG
jgi:anaphase-promoting complex subunit 5